MSNRHPAAGSRARPRSCACPSLGIARSGSFVRESLGVLSYVRMLGAGVDLELVDLLPGEPVPRKHPLHGLAQDLGGPALELVAERPLPQAAGVAGVAVVDLLLPLLAGDRDFVGVHD